MKIFTKKETLKSTIPLMALMIALNTILNVLASYIPFAGYIFVLFLPLVSTLYCLNTKYRYFPIYFICSIAFSFAATIGDITTSLLYLIPSLLEGLIFAVCINKKINIHVSFVLGSIVLFAVQMLFIPLVDFIYSINTISSLLHVFGLYKIPNIDHFVLSIIYSISCIEMLLVCMLVKNELVKFRYEFNTSKTSTFLAIFSIICTLSTILFYIFEQFNFMILFETMIFIIMILLIYELIINKKKATYFVAPISLIISWLLFVLFLQETEMIKATISFSLAPLTISITTLILEISDKIKKEKENKKC